MTLITTKKWPRRGPIQLVWAYVDGKFWRLWLCLPFITINLKTDPTAWEPK